MKKFLSSAFIFTLLLAPAVVFASSPFVSGEGAKKGETAPGGFERFIPTPGSGTASPAGLETTLPAAIGGFINLILGVVGVLMMFITIWAGYIWLTAGGNDSKVQEAKKMISRAAIGLILALSAFAISSYVVGLFERTIFDAQSPSSAATAPASTPSTPK